MVKDMIGQVLNQGDQIGFPIGFGQMGVATVVGISSGLVNPAAPNDLVFPSATVSLQLTIASQPDGRIAGITRVVQAPQQPKGIIE